MTDAESDAEKKKKQDNVRIWDNTLNAWANNGCPKDDPERPIPDKHPETDHLWNRDRQAYCDQNGIPFKFDGGDGGDDVDDY